MKSKIRRGAVPDERRGACCFLRGMFLFQAFFQEFQPLRSRELFCSAPLLLLLWYTAPGALSHAWHVSAVFDKKNLTARSEEDEDEAGFVSSFLTLFPPGRLLDMTESRAATVGRKNARSSVRSSLTPRWKLQQASLKENEMIASLKVCKQRQTSSTVILTPSISNGLASLCHVGRHMSLSLSLPTAAKPTPMHANSKSSKSHTQDYR